MAPKDAFGVVVRTAGLFCLCYGVNALLSALYVALFPKLPHVTTWGWSAVCGAFFARIGLYLLRGAPAMLRLAYPDAPASIPMPAAGTEPRNPWDTNL